MKKFFLTFAVAIAALFSIQAAEPVKIIFDTDMGNDVDDVVALDMLYKYVGIEGLRKWMVGARNLTFAVGAYREEDLKLV